MPRKRATSKSPDPPRRERLEVPEPTSNPTITRKRLASASSSKAIDNVETTGSKGLSELKFKYERLIRAHEALLLKSGEQEK